MGLLELLWQRENKKTEDGGGSAANTERTLPNLNDVTGEVQSAPTLDGVTGVDIRTDPSFNNPHSVTQEPSVSPIVGGAAEAAAEAAEISHAGIDGYTGVIPVRDDPSLNDVRGVAARFAPGNGIGLGSLDVDNVDIQAVPVKVISSPYEMSANTPDTQVESDLVSEFHTNLRAWYESKVRESGSMMQRIHNNDIDGIFKDGEKRRKAADVIEEICNEIPDNPPGLRDWIKQNVLGKYTARLDAKRARGKKAAGVTGEDLKHAREEMLDELRGVLSGGSDSASITDTPAPHKLPGAAAIAAAEAVGVQSSDAVVSGEPGFVDALADALELPEDTLTPFERAQEAYRETSRRHIEALRDHYKTMNLSRHGFEAVKSFFSEKHQPERIATLKNERLSALGELINARRILLEQGDLPGIPDEESLFGECAQMWQDENEAKKLALDESRIGGVRRVMGKLGQGFGSALHKVSRFAETAKLPKSFRDPKNISRTTVLFGVALATVLTSGTFPVYGVIARAGLAMVLGHVVGVAYEKVSTISKKTEELTSEFKAARENVSGLESGDITERLRQLEKKVSQLEREKKRSKLTRSASSIAVTLAAGSTLSNPPTALADVTDRLSEGLQNVSADAVRASGDAVDALEATTGSVVDALDTGAVANPVTLQPETEVPDPRNYDKQPLVINAPENLSSAPAASPGEQNGSPDTVSSEQTMDSYPDMMPLTENPALDDSASGRDISESSPAEVVSSAAERVDIPFEQGSNNYVIFKDVAQEMGVPAHLLDNFAHSLEVILKNDPSLLEEYGNINSGNIEVMRPGDVLYKDAVQEFFQHHAETKGITLPPVTGSGAT